jgi:hypothetical protein
MVKTYFEEKQDPQYAYKIPRKIIVYKNYFSIYLKDPVLFLFGSGPGTFNSRTSFLLNGEYSTSKVFEKVLGIYRPKYASLGVYPLWNSKNSISNLTNGTRNEPFSSIISVLSEYGVLIFGLFALLIYAKTRSMRYTADKYLVSCKNDGDRERITIMLHYLKLSSIFILLGLFTENYLEYPEIMFFYLLGYKLIESTLNNPPNAVSEGQE